MALNINGNIISSTDITSVGVFKTEVNRDSLICYLDAANVYSYPGSGTVWYDLSGNGYNGNFTGGVTYNSGINGGVIITDGSTGYVTVSTPNLAATNFTVMIAAKYDTGNHGRICAGTVNNWLLGWYVNSTENYYAEGWVTSSAGNIGANDTNWRIQTGTGNISNDFYTNYVNGVPQTISGTGGSQGPNGITLGHAGGSGDWSNSYISYLLVYNRVLSSYEIAENFQATRGRYSL